MKLRHWGIRAIIVLGMLCAAQASAQNFPSKPVSIVVPYPAGGATDVIARMVAEKLYWGLDTPLVASA